MPSFRTWALVLLVIWLASILAVAFSKFYEFWRSLP
jgi:hypothetical protein